jgi:hypothetical protein
MPGAKQAPATIDIIMNSARAATVVIKTFNLIPQDTDSPMPE